MAVKPIPDGYSSVIPYLIVNGAAGLIDFLKRVFDAEEGDRVTDAAGKVRHAEVRIGGSVIMIADGADQWPAMPAAVHLYVPDVDERYRRAMAAGATSIAEPTLQFYGDRNANVQDPTGNKWFISTHVEDVPPDEMARRAQAMMK
ncbi:MAG: VOC family protein [Pirellulales bacterium]